MVLEIETAPASIYAATTAMDAALAADAVLVTVHNLSFETKRDGLAEHLGVAEHRVEVLMRPDGRSSGRARVCFPSRAEAEAVIEKVHQTDLDGRTISLSVKRDSTAAGETIVTLRNLPPTTKTGDVTKHVKRVTERGSVGRIILYKKGALSADVAFKSLAEAEAAARKLDGTELAGRTLSARVSPRKPRSVSPRPATPPAPPSSNGSPRAGARSREAVVAALSAWVAAPSEAGAPIGAHAAAASSSSSSRKKPPLTSGRCWRPCAARRSGVSHAEPLGFRPRCGCSL